MKLAHFMAAAVVGLTASTAAIAATAVPENCSAGKTVTAEEAMQIFKGNVSAMQNKAKPSSLPTVFIDPRKVSDYQKGHIPGAINMPIEEGDYTKDALWKVTADGSKSMVVYCNGENCPRSHMACLKAKDFGYSGAIYYFYTGMGPNGWPRINGPTVSGDKSYPAAP